MKTPWLETFTEQRTKTRRGLALFLGTLALYGLAAVVYLALLPGEGGSFLGYSLQRVALMAAALLPSLGMFVLGFVVMREARPRLARRLLSLAATNGLYIAAGLAALLGWTALMLPPYWFGKGAAYFERLRPLVVWLGAVGLQIFVTLTIRRGLRWPDLKRSLREQRSAWVVGLIVLLLWVGGWVIAWVTGLGIQADRYWNEAGVPVLGIQVMLSILIAVLVARLANRAGKPARMEVFIGLALWAGAVLLWAGEPLTRSYFTPGPYYPSLQVYPYSDAAYYDVGGQFMLLGKPLDNNYYVDKPLYMLFLGFLRALAGQSYERTMLLQVLVLALQPVLIYALGREMHSRTSGVLAALLVIFQERNAVVASLYIQVSHVRMMLTESLTALLLIWLALLLLRWWNQKSPGWQGALLAGAVMGTLLLVRPNPLLLIPLIVLFTLVIFRRRILRTALVSVVFIAGILLPVLPWSVVSAQKTGEMYLLNKINLVLDARYRNVPGTDSDFESTLPPEATPTPVKPDALALPPDRLIDTEAGALEFISAHFIHNQLMSVLTLPHTFSLQDVEHTLETPYWLKVKTWDGSLTAENIFLILLNLILLSVGVGAAWQRWKMAGLAPLVLEVGYHLANAMGRTSGGRYLVPVDWVLLLYYALGLAVALQWLNHLRAQRVQRSPMVVAEHKPYSWKWQGVLFGLLGLTLLGGLIPLAGSIFPDRYPTLISAEEAESLAARVNLETIWPENTLSQFIQSGGSVVNGRALYPRFYGIDEGEPFSLMTPQLGARAFPRMTLTLLSAQGSQVVILPAAVATSIPDAADVVVLGCWDAEGRYLDAAMIIVKEAQGMEWITRQPNAPLACPLIEPVCDDNHKCR